MRRIFAAAAAVALTLVAAGCPLVSGTKVFTYTVGNIDLAPGVGFNHTTIDLSNNGVFNDHKADIKLIDRVGFECGLVNNTSTAQTVSVYFSTKSNLTAGEVPAQATVLFKDVSVPASASGTTPDRTIAYDESLTLLQNFTAFSKAVESGNFTFYVLSGGGVDVDISGLVLIVTFTVGL